MAEEHPESPTGAARIYIAGLALACAFRAVDHYQWPWTADSAISAGLSAMLTIGDWKLAWILKKIGPQATRLMNLVATDPRWWIASILVYLMIATLSPFIEQPHWPFSTWVDRSRSLDAQGGSMHVAAEQQKKLTPIDKQGIVTATSHGDLVGTASFSLDGDLKETNHYGIKTVTILHNNMALTSAASFGEFSYTVRFLFSGAEGPYVVASCGDAGMGYLVTENTRDFVELYLRTMSFPGSFLGNSGIIKFFFYEETTK